MGIRMGEGGEGNAFSEDILKIEISGPEVRLRSSSTFTHMLT